MPTASNIADWLVNYRAADIGAPIDAMSLEKHLFYAQGFHLVLRKTELFGDAIEAWRYGPVVSAVWRRYREYDDVPIPKSKSALPPDLDRQTGAFLCEIVTFLAPFRSVQLYQATHEEMPWKTAWARGPNTTISQASIRDWFAAVINDGEEALSRYALLDVVPEPRWGWLYVAGIGSRALNSHPFWAAAFSQWNARLWMRSPTRPVTRRPSHPPTRAEAADAYCFSSVEELDAADPPTT